MTHRAVETIKTEHRNIAQVLRSLENSVRGLTADSLQRREVELIYTMLYYIRVFPDRFHHPKEEDHLFVALERRTREAHQIIADLHEEHERGERLLEEIQRALRDYERGPDVESLKRLQEKVQAYVELEFRHMDREEEELLPIAERWLEDSDWTDVDNAFSSNVDPLFQSNIQLGFDTLYKRIVASGSKSRFREP